MLHSLYNFFSLASHFGSILNSERLRIEVYLRLEIYSLFSFIEEGLHMTQTIIAKHFKGGNQGIVFQHLILAS